MGRRKREAERRAKEEERKARKAEKRERESSLEDVSLLDLLIPSMRRYP